MSTPTIEPVPVGAPTYLAGRVPDIVSFTIREAPSLEHIVQTMRYWIADTLVPYVNENVQYLSDEWAKEVQELIDSWEAQSVALIAQVQEIADGVTDEAEKAEAAQIAAELARDQAEMFASQVQAIQDEAVTTIFNDPNSEFRQSANGVYANPVPDYLMFKDVSTLAELQAAFDTASAQGLRVWANGEITTEETLNVTASANLEGLTLTHTGNVPAVSIGTSNVTLEGLTIVGPGNTGAVHLSRAIYVKGTLENYVENVAIRNVTIRGFKMMGVSLEFVRGFNVEGCDIDDVFYGGIHAMSVNDGVISRNRVSNVTGAPLAYGITINKAVAPEDVAPRSTDVIVSENIVTNVPNWEGLDTHGGERLSFINNTVTGCHRGIAIVYGLATVGGPAEFGCHDIVVSGNIIDSMRTDGGAGFGISFAGASAAVGTPTDYNTGVITNNIVRNHGDATDSTLGCFYIHSTKGVVVSGNHLINPSAIGINMSYNNDEFMVIGNTITEVWGTTTDRCIAIALRNQYNYGTVAANRLASNGEHAGAAWVNHTGFQIVNFNNTRALAYGNEFSKALNPIGATAQTNMFSQFMASAVVPRAPMLTAASEATVDDVYGTNERDVINNLRTRVNSIASALQNLGFIATS